MPDAMGVRLRHDQPNTNRFTPLDERKSAPDWSELPLDLLPLMFSKIGAVDLLMGAGLVCRSWREAARVPEAWRCVDLEYHTVARTKEPHVLSAMARVSVDRSDGRIESFTGASFVTDDLLKYVAEKSPCLKRLSISCCSVSNQGLLDLIGRTPLLEELILSMCKGITPDTYQVAPIVCPRLNRFIIEEPHRRCPKNRIIRTMVRFPYICFKEL